MESDEPLGKQIIDVSDKMFRFWAVTIGLALIMGRLLYIQENHTVVLDNLVEASQDLKTELESLKTQTRTYQQGASGRLDRIENQLDSL